MIIMLIRTFAILLQNCNEKNLFAQHSEKWIFPIAVGCNFEIEAFMAVYAIHVNSSRLGSVDSVRGSTLALIK